MKFKQYVDEGSYFKDKKGAYSKSIPKSLKCQECGKSISEKEAVEMPLGGKKDPYQTFCKACAKKHE